jgi:hypothetical protein
MDLPTIASLAEAFAVIVAVVFGMVQLRQLCTETARSGLRPDAFDSVAPDVAWHPNYDRLQDASAKAEFDALPENDQVDVTALLATWESLGILVFNQEIPLQMVDDFYSGTLQQSWRKLQRYVEELRETTAPPDALGVDSMAGRTNAERGIGHATYPGLRSASQMEAAFLSLSGRG